MDIGGFFKKLGRAFEAAGRFILRFVSDVDIDIAVKVVQDAAVLFVDNGERRGYAVTALMNRLHLPESIARWLVETALMRLKQEVLDVVDAAGDKAKVINE